MLLLFPINIDVLLILSNRYIDIRDDYTMVISTFGEKEYEDMFNKEFTVTLNYEGQDTSFAIERTWTVQGW